MNPDHSPAQHGSDKPNPWPLARWILLLPVMGAVFLGTGIAASILLVVALKLDPPWVATACAFTWVLTAYLMAPSRRLLAASLALITGIPLAALLFLGLRGGFSSVLPAFAATVLCGVLALGLCASLDARRRRIPGLPDTAPIPPESRRPPSPSPFPTIPSAILNTMNEKLRKLLKDNRLLRWSVLLITAVIAINIALGLARSVVDVVRQDQRGLYMRFGRYVRTLEPGMHLKVPLIDEIQRVSVRERQGYIRHVDAMTEDNVLMRVSLQYTYKIEQPEIYYIAVDKPDAIISEFVQGRLRDIVNTTTMSDVMKKRSDLTRRILDEIREREHAYGIRFELVQIQGTYPPEEVQDAIKQRMVAEQRTIAAKQDAEQTHILADASLYKARKEAEATRFQIEETARARKESISLLMDELAKDPVLGPKFLDYLMTQELRDNSKWILSGDQSPDLHILDSGQ